MKRIVVRLDVMLARRKLKARELAEQIGITEANLSLLRTGKVKGVRFDTLAQLCEALGCTPGDLLEVEDEDAKKGTETVEPQGQTTMTPLPME
jgi:putative transcriptional regulator